jgi:hypothetical protein
VAGLAGRVARAAGVPAVALVLGVVLVGVYDAALTPSRYPYSAAISR